MSGRAEVIRALGVLGEPPGPAHARVAAALDLPGSPSSESYVDVFLLQAYPYASVHLGREGMMGGEARDRVAGFWRALGLVPPAEPDHLSALLGLYAALIDAEEGEPEPARAVLRRSSRNALLWEHLLTWCPPYLEKVAAIAPPLYRAWAELLAVVLVEEARRDPAPTNLPLALREADGLPAPDSRSDDWIAALLAPVRSGLIVTRIDLARCARTLDLGLRMGERAYVLKALLEQDGDGTARWLAGQADASAASHGRLAATLGEVGRFWQGRAEATAQALRGVLT
jgi:hypothetical protein